MPGETDCTLLIYRRQKTTEERVGTPLAVVAIISAIFSVTKKKQLIKFKFLEKIDLIKMEKEEGIKFLSFTLI